MINELSESRFKSESWFKPSALIKPNMFKHFATSNACFSLNFEINLIRIRHVVQLNLKLNKQLNQAVHRDYEHNYDINIFVVCKFDAFKTRLAAPAAIEVSWGASGQGRQGLGCHFMSHFDLVIKAQSRQRNKTKANTFAINNNTKAVQ